MVANVLGFTVKAHETSDKINQLRDAQKLLQSVDVLVGVPESGAERKGGAVNNAELVYIHTHGVAKSPVRAEANAAAARGDDYFTAREAAMNLYLMEHGSPVWQIPPRPIIEPAIEDKKEVIGALFAKAYGKLTAQAISGTHALTKEDAVREFSKIGQRAEGIVRAWFTDENNNWTPNAPSTIRKKGSERPLIDTGEMRKAITFVVEIK
jgi:hypothetical protein